MNNQEKNNLNSNPLLKKDILENPALKENGLQKEKCGLKNQIIDIFKGPRNLLTVFLNILGAIFIGYALIEWSKWFIKPGTAIIIGLILIVFTGYFVRPFKDKE